MKDPVFELCDRIRETAFDLHRHLRHGHLEKIYEAGLCHRLRKAGIKVETQRPLNGHDEDGTLLGELFVDVLVEEELLLELKAVNTLTDDHTAQLLGY